MDRPRKTGLSVAELGDLCLSQLAQDASQLADFMGVTGYDPSGLRAAVGTPQLAAGLIDYFAGNEPLLLSLCANHGLRPEDVMRVWQRLNRAQ